MTIITVIEPHSLLRLGILQLLSDLEPGIALDGSDYSPLFSGSADDTRPRDLLLLSVNTFDDMHRLITAAEVVYSPKAILLLSENSDLTGSIHHLPESVSGYVKKNASPQVLQASVRLILAGGTCFPMRSSGSGNASDRLVTPYPPVRWPLAEKSDNPDRTNAPDKTRKNAIVADANIAEESAMLGLTPRQYEVLVLLARGHPMKTVGRYLNISVATAKAHTEMLYQRLDVHNRNAAVYAAVSRGATLGWPAKVASQYAQQQANTL
ncbi:MAG: LuxR C-terminal-related transcriptional regulator [Candidimonas sp.]|jgi:two-component system nitrate/nitrite response regulator NarL